MLLCAAARWRAVCRYRLTPTELSLLVIDGDLNRDVVTRKPTTTMQPQLKGKAMPTISEMYPGKYLSAPDLKNQEVTVTIERVEMEQFDDAGRKVMKPVVYFQGSDKAMVFNKTNATSVVDITGQDNTDNWGGA